jgi:phosphoserine phosphatase
VDQKKSAVFVDVDGTLINGGSAWERIHRYFNVSDQAKIYYNQARNKEINYETWAKLDTKLWYGKPYEDIYNAVHPVQLVNDAKEGVDLLKQHFDYVILVSGGIDVLVNQVSKDVGANFAISNRILQKNGKINGEVDIKVGDSKLDTIKILADQFNLDLNRCAAIGDDFNDIDMFKGVKHAIAYNSKTKDLDEVACLTVRSQSFLEPVQRLLDLFN